MRDSSSLAKALVVSLLILFVAWCEQECRIATLEQAVEQAEARADTAIDDAGTDDGGTAWSR